MKIKFKTGFIVLFILSVVIAYAFGPGEGTQLSNDIAVKAPDYWVHDTGMKIVAVSLLIAGSVSVFFLFGAQRTRRIIILIISTVIAGFILGGFLCPISVVQNVFLKFDSAYLILFLIPLVATVAFGRFFCGYVCPFGAISELLHLRKFRIKIPEKWDKPFRFIKYAVLGFLVIRVLVSGEAVTDLTPFKALFTFGGEWINWLLTGLFIVLSVFFYRPFCKYLCPYGAIMAVLTRFSLLRIKAGKTCVDCRLCSGNCSMGAMGDDIKTSGECILCGECCTNCPRESLSISLSYNKKEKVVE